MLKYNRLKCQLYSDTFFLTVDSVQGNKCGQLFTTEFGFCKFVPMKNKSEAGYALQETIREIGIPNHIHMDGAKELTQGKWRDICWDANITTTQTERDSPWQNRTEIEIRELKRHVRRFMTRTKTPSILWDFCCQYTAELRNYLARPLPQLHARTPHEILTGNTPDISEFLEFTWYEPVWYYKPAPFPEQTRKLVRWIGVAHRVGQAMCFWLLPMTGVPMARTTIQKIQQDDLTTDLVKNEIIQLDRAIEHNLKVGDLQMFSLYHENLYEEDIAAEEPVQPEAIYDNVDDNGVDELLFDAIIGHERLPITETNLEPQVRSTKRWKICIAWQDRTLSWHSLSNVKNSYLLHLAEYAVKNQLDKEPAFSWWIKTTLKHKRTFIKAAKRRFAKRTHKFGIKVPQTVLEALEIDKQTKTTFWRDMICKEMKNNRLAFQFFGK